MFENTLIASRGRGEVTRKLEVLPVVLGIHAITLGFVLVTQLWAVNEVPEPYTIVSFYNAPPPPPPVSRLPARGTTPATKARPVSHVLEVPPTTLPTYSAKRVERDHFPGPGDSDPRIYIDWDRNPNPGPFEPFGTGVEPVAGEVDTPRVLSPEMKPPVAVYHPAPVYPEAALAVRRQGAVIVEAVIDRKGSVVEAKVLRDLGFGLGEAALRAIRTWRYQPATLDGRPVTVYLTVTVKFELHGAR